MEDNWYYAESGAGSYGPMSARDLGQVLRTRPSASNFLVWCPGMADWTRAADVQVLRQFFSPRPPPLPTGPRVESPRPTPARLSELSAGARIVPSHASVLPEEENASAKIHPWRRYFARMFDLWTFSLIFFFFLGLTFPEFFGGKGSKGNQGLDGVSGLAAMLAYVPFEAFCLHAFGSTPGKALYGIRVRDSFGRELPLSISFKRAFAVWFRGLGLGIPIVALFTSISAYATLSREKQTSWDRDFNCLVSFRHLSVVGLLVLILAWTLLAGTFALLIALAG
jgi:uncharacterized RDD family membrane protein YckC